MSILTDYPKAEKEMKEFLLGQMKVKLDEEKDVPEDFKELVLQQGIPDDQIDLLYKDHPRVFFELFDKYKLIINVMASDDEENEGKVIFTFCAEITLCNDIYETRIEAERAAVLVGIELLEKGL